MLRRCHTARAGSSPDPFCTAGEGVRDPSRCHRVSLCLPGDVGRVALPSKGSVTAGATTATLLPGLVLLQRSSVGSLITTCGNTTDHTLFVGVCGWHRAQLGPQLSIEVGRENGHS